MEASTQQTKKCPMCGEEVLAEAKICKHCRSVLEKRPLITVPRIVGVVVLALIGALAAGYSKRSALVVWALGREIAAGIAEGRPVCEEAARQVVDQKKASTICSTAESNAREALEAALADPTYDGRSTFDTRRSYSLILSEPGWSKRPDARRTGRSAFYQALGQRSAELEPILVPGITYAEMKAARSAISDRMQQYEDAQREGKTLLAAPASQPEAFALEGVAPGMTAQEASEKWQRLGVPKISEPTGYSGPGSTPTQSYTWETGADGRRFFSINVSARRIYSVAVVRNQSCKDALRSVNANFGQSNAGAVTNEKWRAGTVVASAFEWGPGHCRLEIEDDALRPQ